MKFSSLCKILSKSVYQRVWFRFKCSPSMIGLVRRRGFTVYTIWRESLNFPDFLRESCRSLAFLFVSKIWDDFEKDVTFNRDKYFIEWSNHILIKILHNTFISNRKTWITKVLIVLCRIQGVPFLIDRSKYPLKYAICKKMVLTKIVQDSGGH